MKKTVFSKRAGYLFNKFRQLADTWNCGYLSDQAWKNILPCSWWWTINRGNRKGWGEADLKGNKDVNSWGEIFLYLLRKEWYLWVSEMLVVASYLTDFEYSWGWRRIFNHRFATSLSLKHTWGTSYSESCCLCDLCFLFTCDGCHYFLTRNCLKGRMEPWFQAERDVRVCAWHLKYSLIHTDYPIQQFSFTDKLRNNCLLPKQFINMHLFCQRTRKLEYILIKNASKCI